MKTFLNPAHLIVFNYFNTVDNSVLHFSNMNSPLNAPKKNSSLSGRISCATTQKKLEGVVIVVEELSLITVTDANGEFVFNFSTQLYLPEHIRLSFSNESHQDFTLSVDLQNLSFLNISLVPEIQIEQKSFFYHFKKMIASFF